MVAPPVVSSPWATAGRQIRLLDIPCFGRPVRLSWAKRLWRCPDEDCPRKVFSEEHPLAGKRAILTSRTMRLAVDALEKYDTSVSALAHQLGVSWRPGFTNGIKVATLDPFRGYANAIRDELPEAITVVDAFHIVKLGTGMVDDVRRRVQQDTLGHRGRKDDPLYGIRRTLQQGIESLTEKQVTRLEQKLEGGDTNHEVTIAWHCYQSSAPSTTPGPRRDAS